VQSVDDLRSLSPSALRQHIQEVLSDDEEWEALLHPALVTTTFAALTGLMMDIDSQLGQRRSLQGARTVGLTKAEAAPLKAEYESWRTRALGFRRLILGRMDLAKLVIAECQRQRQEPGYTPPGQPTTPNAKRGNHNTQSLYRLAQAVLHHREQTRDAGLVPAPHDEQLWQKLRTLSAYSTNHGESSLRDWLERSMHPPTPTENEA